MSEDIAQDISVKTFQDFITTVISEVNAPARDKSPAYTLIIGSGFSSGLIPTAYDMAMNDIPWWKYSDRPDEFTKPATGNSDFTEERNSLWKSIKDEEHRNPKIPPLDMDESGFPTDDPDNIANCYKAIMCASAGLSSQNQRTEYLRDVVKRSENEINYAHLFLAGILKAQNTEAWEKELQHRRPFCKTVLTTNFDTLLQRSLQLNNQLFFVSDQPDGSFEKPTDNHDAIHIVQTHGSIFRPFVANNDEEIKDLMEKNAPAFKDYFENRGIIVIGYGGWVDTLMKALTDCRHFNGNLFWCDIHPKGSLHRLRSNVRELLSQHHQDAFYVPLPSNDGADLALQELHDKLGLKRYPQIIVDPLTNLIDSIKGLKLPKSLLTKNTSPKNDIEKIAASSLCDIENPSLTIEGVLDLLNTFKTEFTHPKTVEGKMVLGRALALDSKWDEARELFTQVIKMTNAPDELKAQALFNRGFTYAQQEDWDVAIKDYTAVIKMPEATEELKVKALNNRGITYAEKGDSEAEIKDFTQVIEMPTVTDELKAQVLVNRGVRYFQQEELDAAIKDYTTVIEMPTVTDELKAHALVNRGVTYGKKGDSEAGIKNYTQVIDMPNAPDELKAKALVNRGVAYGKKGDSEAEIKDYTQVMEMPNATDEQKAQALVNRGVRYFQQGNTEKAIEDYTQVMEMPNAPDEQKAKAEAFLKEIDNNSDKSD